MEALGVASRLPGGGAQARRSTCEALVPSEVLGAPSSSSSSSNNNAPPLVPCGKRATVKRPRTGARSCRDCFVRSLEDEVHAVIASSGMFRRGDRVAVAASGGKDSTVLAALLSTLNARHGYGLELTLLSVDEGIAGYRDASLDTVRENAASLSLPLRVVSYAELYDGHTMDSVVRITGLRNNCTFCGVFRRQALDRGARAVGADVIATGHNADDMAETVLMNLLRGDIARLGRCTAISSRRKQAKEEGEGAEKGEMAGAGDAGGGGRGGAGGGGGGGGADGAAAAAAAADVAAPAPAAAPSHRPMPRVKPLKFCFEKEIVLYARARGLAYHSTECLYSPQAYRGFAREWIKDLEALRPSSLLDVVSAAEGWRVDDGSGGGRGAKGFGAVGRGRGDDDDDDDDDLDDDDVGARGRGGGGGGAADFGGTQSSSAGGKAPSRGRRKQQGGLTLPSAAGCGGVGLGDDDGGDEDDRSSVGGRSSSSSAAGSTTSSRSSKLTSAARVQRPCRRCGSMASRELCQACTLLASLAAGAPRVALTNARHAKKLYGEEGVAAAAAAAGAGADRGGPGRGGAVGGGGAGGGCGGCSCGEAEARNAGAATGRDRSECCGGEGGRCGGRQ